MGRYGELDPTITRNFSDEIGTKEQQPTPEEPLAWQRQICYLKDRYYFEYGEIYFNHPTQEYVSKLAERIPRKEGFPLEVVLLPDWEESNAASLPDGTVFVSARLIKEVETEEALLGVLAHEYTHAYREHSKKASEKLVVSKKTFLEYLGLQRLHEYEADLRGVLVDLEQAGVNPLGFKEFLEKLYSREKYGGIVHGSSLDRALNISTAIHTVDLKSLAGDLHDIPEDMITALDTSTRKQSLKAIVHRPQVFYASKEQVVQRRKEREELLNILTKEEIPFAMQAVLEHATRYEKSEDRDPDDEAILYTLIDIFEDATIPQDLSEEEKNALGLVSLELFGKLPIFADQGELLQEWFERSHKVLNNSAQWEKVRQLLEDRVAEFGYKYIHRSIPEFAYNLVQYVINQKVFGEFSDTNLDFQALQNFLQNWAKTLAKISEQYDRSGVQTEQQIYDYMVRTVSALASNQIKLRAKFHRELNPEVELIPKSQKFFEAGADIGQVEEFTEFRPKLEQFFKKNAHKWKDKTLLEIAKSLSFIMDGVAVGRDEFMGKHVLKTNKKTNDEVIQLDFEYIFRSPEYVSIWLLHKAITTLPQFNKMKEREKKLLLFVAADHLEIQRHLTSELVLYVDDDDFADEMGISDDVEIARSYTDDAMYEDSDDNMYEYTPVDVPVYKDDEYLGKVKKKKNVRLRLNPKITRAVKERIRELNLYLDKEFMYTGTLVGTVKDALILYSYWLDTKYYNQNIGVGKEKKADNNSVGTSKEREYVNYLIAACVKKDFLQTWQFLNECEASGIPVFRMFERYSSLEDDARGTLVLKLIEAFKDETIYQLDFKEILRVTEWVQNFFLKSALQRTIKDRYWKDLNFDERLDFILPTKGHVGVIDPESKEDFFEKDVRTREQFQAVKERLRYSVDDIISTGSERAGVASILGYFDFKNRNVNAFLKALLKSSESDKDLKLFMYELIRPYVTEKSHTKLQENIRMSDGLVQALYSLDDLGRQLLLRHVMTADWGALQNLSRRKEFLRFLLEEWVNDPNGTQQDLTQVLKNVKGSLETVKEWELLYFALQNALRDKIAQSPAKPTEWQSIYEIKDNLEKLDVPTKEVAQFLRQAMWKRIPASAQKRPWEYMQLYLFYANQQLYNTLQSRGLLAEARRERLTPLRFTKETVSRTGAFGVRFLQVAPQFVNIPEDYVAEFSQVYDSIKGQSKLAALNMLEREWPTMWEEISEVENRVGGGSMVTVYEMRNVKGEREVVKVRNPNIEYHLEETYRFAKLVLDDLAQKHGGGYLAAQVALDDIYEWIKKDISFIGFLERDQKFRERYQGYTAENHNYKIKIPQSKGPENEYFSREEYIEGKNLTKWEELAGEGHDMRQVASLLVKHYIQQVMDGIVHSDVHIGNFRITPEKEIAVLDRNFYLELNPESQAVIFGLLNPFTTNESRAATLLDFLSKESAGNIGDDARSIVGALVDDMSKQEWTAVHAQIVRIKQMGVKIPLYFTLLLKNFNSLQIMAKKAGFETLTEAYLFNP